MRCDRCKWRAPVLYAPYMASLQICSGCFLEVYDRLPEEDEVVEVFDPVGRRAVDTFGDWS